MCGIFGIYSRNIAPAHSVLAQGIAAVQHRGPDDFDIWCQENVGLAHARLSIHDLTQAGRQPMFSASKQWVIVLNGEIYNFKELKLKILAEARLEFKGSSDTEVLVNAIDLWGIERTLKSCVGMFAFAAYHIPTRKLYLARDRFGEKPLYFGRQNNVFSFSSELKSLKPLKSMGWHFDIDRDVLATYSRFGYVPTPYSIYRHISKLDSGCYLEVNDSGCVKITPYWNSSDVLKMEKFTGSYVEAVDSLEERLKHTLQLQMASDVPLGAFLSGGVDSSTIVALMQSLSSTRVNTFSIGFSEAAYNEAEYARAVAKHLGTHHTDLYFGEKDALDLVPRLPDMYDEPFADSSQLPTYLVSNIARSAVTVSLSGDAGDELFGGYQRYFMVNRIKKSVLDNQVLKYFLYYAPLSLMKKISHCSNRLNTFIDRLLKLRNIVRNANNCGVELYKQFCSQHPNQPIVLDSTEHSVYHQKGLHAIASDLSFQELMMFADSKIYMIDDILTKVDRAAMANSLETRIPFLDHRIYQFAWSLPLHYKIANGVGKCVLRDVLYRYVPKQLIDRPKMGFAVPVAKWLRGELKDWAASLLEPSLIRQQGYLNSDYVSTVWNEHQSNSRNRQAPLWTLLMFQSWLMHSL